MFRALHTIPLLVALAACTGKDDSDTDTGGTEGGGEEGGGTEGGGEEGGGTEGGGTEGGGEEGGGTEGGGGEGGGGDTVELRLSVIDLGGGGYVTGVPVTIGDQTEETASDGFATFNLATNSVFEAQFSGDGYIDSALWFFSLEEDFSSSIGVFGESTLDLLASLYGVSFDAAKGAFHVRIYHRGSDGALSDIGATTLDLDVSYDLALHADASSATGLGVGNTTLDGSTTRVFFVNVEPGEVELTITAPDTEDYCTWYRGDTLVEDWNPTVAANKLTTVYVVCYGAE